MTMPIVTDTWLDWWLLASQTRSEALQQFLEMSMRAAPSHSKGWL
jgi:hypothetical protein